MILGKFPHVCGPRISHMYLYLLNKYLRWDVVFGVGVAIVLRVKYGDGVGVERGA